MSQKTKKSTPVPVWYKNTYFWIAAVLFILGIIGLPIFGGDEAIRDPGQKKEGHLFVFYFIASVVMFAGGWISHKQTIQHFEEETGQ